MMYAMPKSWINEGSPCFVSDRKLTLSSLAKEKAKDIYGVIGKAKEVIIQRIASIESILTAFTVTAIPAGNGFTIQSFAVTDFADVIEPTSENFRMAGKRIVPRTSSLPELQLSGADREKVYREFLATKRAEYKKILER
jgi:hypothetical protein